MRLGLDLHIKGSSSTVGDGAADSASESEAVIAKREQGQSELMIEMTSTFQGRQDGR